MCLFNILSTVFSSKNVRLVGLYDLGVRFETWPTLDRNTTSTFCLAVGIIPQARVPLRTSYRYRNSTDSTISSLHHFKIPTRLAKSSTFDLLRIHVFVFLSFTLMPNIDLTIFFWITFTFFIL